MITYENLSPFQIYNIISSINSAICDDIMEKIQTDGDAVVDMMITALEHYKVKDFSKQLEISTEIIEDLIDKNKKYSKRYVIIIESLKHASAT
jgi:DNA-binding ferritin-like protein